MAMLLLLATAFLTLWLTASLLFSLKGNAMFMRAAVRLASEIDLAESVNLEPEQQPVISRHTSQARSMLQQARAQQTRGKLDKALSLTMEGWDALTPCFTTTAGHESRRPYRPLPADAAQLAALETLSTVKSVSLYSFFFLVLLQSVLYFSS